MQNCHQVLALCVLAYRCLVGSAQHTFLRLCVWRPILNHVFGIDPYRHYAVPLTNWVVTCFRWSLRGLGTRCQYQTVRCCFSCLHIHRSFIHRKLIYCKLKTVLFKWHFLAMIAPVVYSYVDMIVTLTFVYKWIRLFADNCSNYSANVKREDRDRQKVQRDNTPLTQHMNNITHLN